MPGEALSGYPYYLGGLGGLPGRGSTEEGLKGCRYPMGEEPCACHILLIDTPPLGQFSSVNISGQQYTQPGAGPGTMK